jgi:diadenosine tetraphosphate (Ap4A) HIT family hydrolase
MFNYRIMLVLMVPSMLFGNMFQRGSQLEFCPASRQTYILANIKAAQDAAKASQQPQQSQQPAPQEQKKCPFCDQEILSQNYILSEDHQCDVRVIMNKFPYYDFDQGEHLLIMPQSHNEIPGDLPSQLIMAQTDAAQEISGKLHDDAYSQEYFTNWGRMAGQSVPHWHSQFKNYKKAPLSLPERTKEFNNALINNIGDAFKVVKERFAASTYVSMEKYNNTLMNRVRSFVGLGDHSQECPCCSVRNTQDSDEENFVIARFKHNYLCLAHYPFLPGELAVVPNRHVSSIKDLSQEELRENMIIATALLPMLKEYAQTGIRECGGGNIYTKSLGGKAPNAEQQKYHVHTLVVPRTTIQPTPGTLEGNSCKLDGDPMALFAYFKNKRDELNKKVM